MDDEAFFKAVEEFLKYNKQTVEYEKNFAILGDFTDEELAQELLRRTSLGKELE